MAMSEKPPLSGDDIRRALAAQAEKEAAKAAAEKSDTKAPAAADKKG